MKNLNKFLLKHAPIMPIEGVAEARKAWAAFRASRGNSGAPALLTPPDANAKFAKTPVPIYGLSLTPDKSSGEYSVCDYSTPECRKGCVAYAGMGEAPNVLVGRTLKTLFLAAFPREFVTLLAHEIDRAEVKHDK